VELWNDDPRLRDVLAPELLPETAGLRELGDFLLDPIQHEQLKSCIQLLYDELARQNAQTLEEAAREIISRADQLAHEIPIPGRRHNTRPCDPEVIEGLLHRYGLLGDSPGTLETMGRVIGRTRERARQIEGSHTAALRSTRPYWPQLDRALKLARSMVPCHEEDISAQLIRHKLTVLRYSSQSLRACANFAGRDFELEAVNGAVSLSSPELASVVHVTKALAGRQGMASLLQISDDLVDDGIIIPEGNVRTDLMLTHGVVWLDYSHVTWPGVRNRLVNTLRMMLSVHQPVELESARQAITDFWTYRNAGRTPDQKELIPPTSDALRAFCSWHPDFAIVRAGHGDGIISTVDLDFTTELGVEAAMLVELIRSAPDAATDRVTLLDAAEAVGMKSTTVGVYLSFHPAFTNPARNVWTTLGTQLTSETIHGIQQLALQRSRDEARDLVTGLDPDDRPWAALAVTSNLRMSGVLLRQWLPPDVRSVRLSATDGLGEACGTVVYNADNGFTHGLSPYLRRFDIRVGECLLLTADLEWETVQITHGGRHLLLGPHVESGGR
jgi:hypothetical protein